MLNYKKPRKVLFYKGFYHYLPQHCLYFFPEPHGKILKQPGNFFLLNWCFLFKDYNFLLNNYKFLFNNLSKNLSKKLDLFNKFTRFYFFRNFFSINKFIISSSSKNFYISIRNINSIFFWYCIYRFLFRQFH